MTRTSLDKTYEPGALERPIYEMWLERDIFHARPDERPPERRYVIMMPLPNVTGALHMGHAMDNTMQDLLVRWHRMAGDNTLWMPGTDHAGIATQAVVEKRLKELEGKTRHDVGRDGLVERIWRWKDQFQARIVQQQQRMGFSCDWRRARFTMDPVCARAVRHAFFRMFSDGLIFRGKRLVNWDVFLQTSVSDDEVYHETVPGHFWHLRYPVIDPRPGEPDHVVVATTRPETMLGDTAVAVHPDPEAALAARAARLEESLARAPDKEREALSAELAEVRRRQRELLPALLRLRDMARDGRRVRLPLLDRPLPLVLDTWAKPELGSGCVKITPAHDPNDYEVWRRHRDEIDIINILRPDGTLAEVAGPYAGLDRYAARERVVADLDALGLLEAVEDRDVEVGHSDRSKTPVEPYLSDQWFIRMGDLPGGVRMGRGTPKEHTSPGLVQAAIDAVDDGRVTIHPPRYTRTYRDWLAEKRDWPISRQLWWGHRIPIWSARVSGPGDPRVAEVRALLGAGVAARLADPESGRSHDLTAGAPPSGDGFTALDVCLLADDPEAVAALEALGLERDPDVLDTWFSSALWPFSTLGWPDPATAPTGEGEPPMVEGGRSLLDYYYPGSCLVTGRDIITLWVARMVLAGLYTMGEVPFSDVFIHANILDGKGERMSKSKGNGIDPVDIISRYGADAMRYVLCDMQTGTQDIRLPVTAICPRCQHHNDLGRTAHGASVFTYVCGKTVDGRGGGGCGQAFDVLGTMGDLPAATLISERFEVGRAFCTKLWNSARFALMNLEAGVPETPPEAEALAPEDRWILDRLSRAVGAVEEGLRAYSPSAALGAAREFFWGDLCDWYLELIKARLAGDDAPDAGRARQVLAFCLDQTLRLLHPFLPFVTEYLWQRLGERAPARGLGPLGEAPASEALAVAAWPERRPALEDDTLAQAFALAQAATRGVREVRASAGVPPRQAVAVTVKADPAREAALRPLAHVVTRLANVERLTFDASAARAPGSAAKVVGGVELLVHGVIDDDEERRRLEKELQRVEKEIARCEKKLANERFLARAPAEVVAEQRARLAGYEASREAIRRGLTQLG